jgi:hypothetical protein
MSQPTKSDVEQLLDDCWGTNLRQGPLHIRARRRAAAPRCGPRARARRRCGRQGAPASRRAARPPRRRSPPAAAAPPGARFPRQHRAHADHRSLRRGGDDMRLVARASALVGVRDIAEAARQVGHSDRITRPQMSSVPMSNRPPAAGRLSRRADRIGHSPQEPCAGSVARGRPAHSRRAWPGSVRLVRVRSAECVGSQFTCSLRTRRHRDH